MSGRRGKIPADSRANAGRATANRAVAQTNPDRGKCSPEFLREECRVAALGEALSSARGVERERLERILNLLPCYVALIDKEHRILYHNAAFEECFGVPDGKPCYTAMRGLTAPCFFCPSRESLKKRGRPSVIEWPHPDNRRVFRVHSHPFIDNDGTPCVLEAGFNVTANVRMRQALELSEKSYRAITDNLTIGIALLDPELRIKVGNTRLSRWFAEGFRLDRRICGLLRCSSNWETAEQGGGFCPDCPFKASILDKQGHEKEFSVTFQDGKERNVRMVACPVMADKGKGQTGRVRALLLMLEDITNRLRVNQQLQRARKLEAMNTLAGGIAHEINQPLSALHLYAGGLQMLLEKPGTLPQETTQERLSLIMREADKISSIIAHMRSLVTREGRVALHPVSLASAVESAREIMRRQIEAHGVELVVEIPESLPRILANDIQLEQVLINLLSNAIHAVHGTPLREDGRAARRICIRAHIVPETGQVRLEVADSGPGLPPTSERIFDPFFTTKERHEGMGMGLSIVHALVSLWGGEVRAVPRHPVLGGAVFYLDLLTAAEHPDPAKTPEALGEAAENRPGSKVDSEP